MKKIPRRFLGLTAALVMALTLLSPLACAAVTASDYFAVTAIIVTPVGGGRFAVEADAMATEIMDEVGVKSITIYERQSDGSYDDVASWTRYNTIGMIATNNITNYKRVYYDGTAGTKYYATVSFYAKNSEGSETITRNSEVITA